MAFFRLHRGTLKESMETLTVAANVRDIKHHIYIAGAAGYMNDYSDFATFNADVDIVAQLYSLCSVDHVSPTYLIYAHDKIKRTTWIEGFMHGEDSLSIIGDYINEHATTQL